MIVDMNSCDISFVQAEHPFELLKAGALCASKQEVALNATHPTTSLPHVMKTSYLNTSSIGLNDFDNITASSSTSDSSSSTNITAFGLFDDDDRSHNTASRSVTDFLPSLGSVLEMVFIEVAETYFERIIWNLITLTFFPIPAMARGRVNRFREHMSQRFRYSRRRFFFVDDETFVHWIATGQKKEISCLKATVRMNQEKKSRRDCQRRG